MGTSSSLADSFSVAVAKLYDAATVPEFWPATLDALLPLVDSTAGHFFLWDSTVDCPSNSLPSTSYRGQEDFCRCYGRMDPRRQLLMQRPIGFLLRCHEHFDADFVARDPFYNEFSLPLGRRWLMTSSLWEEAGKTAIFAVFRTETQARYSDADRIMFQRLLPHIRRATTIYLRLQAARAETALGQDLLDTLPQMLFATDASARIRRSNRAGEALLGVAKILSQQRGRLLAATPAETAMLHAAIRRAVEALPEVEPGPATSVVLHGLDGARLGVTVSPLPRHSGLPGLPDQRLALVTAVPMEARRPDSAPLRAAFGFTLAEGELAAALAGGQRLDSFAAARGVGMPTVRTQLRAVFEKTQTNRQAELVRLLTRVPTATPQSPGGMP